MCKFDDQTTSFDQIKSKFKSVYVGYNRIFLRDQIVKTNILFTS